jgi:ABC-2 type transport system permease protein
MSALTKSQIIAFIVTGSVCLLFVLAGFPLVLDFFDAWVPQWVMDTLSGLSVLNHFVAITRGVVSLKDGLYFLSMVALWLYLTVLALEAKRGS